MTNFIRTWFLHFHLAPIMILLTIAISHSDRFSCWLSICTTFIVTASCANYSRRQIDQYSIAMEQNICYKKTTRTFLSSYPSHRFSKCAFLLTTFSCSCSDYEIYSASYSSLFRTNQRQNVFAYVSELRSSYTGTVDKPFPIGCSFIRGSPSATQDWLFTGAFRWLWILQSFLSRLICFDARHVVK